MRLTIAAAWLVLALASGALAQPAPRFEVGPVLRLDTVFVEGALSGGVPAAGLCATYRLTRVFSIEGEVTGASSGLERSYQGSFISYAQGPNASREEIERLAPTARRTLRYSPGVGLAGAIAARATVNRRVDVTLRVGLSLREYAETSSTTVLAIPAGVDPARVAADFQGLTYSRDRLRGGLLLGMGVPVGLSRHLVVEPELRFVYGGPARVGSKHRELGLGGRVAWRF